MEGGGPGSPPYSPTREDEEEHESRLSGQNSVGE